MNGTSTFTKLLSSTLFCTPLRGWKTQKIISKIPKQKTRRGTKTKTQPDMLTFIFFKEYTTPVRKPASIAYQWPWQSPALSASFLRRIHTAILSVVHQGENLNILSLLKLPYITSNQKEPYTFLLGGIRNNSEKHFPDRRPYHWIYPKEYSNKQFYFPLRFLFRQHLSAEVNLI